MRLPPTRLDCTWQLSRKSVIPLLILLPGAKPPAFTAKYPSFHSSPPTDHYGGRPSTAKGNSNLLDSSICWRGGWESRGIKAKVCTWTSFLTGNKFVLCQCGGWKYGNNPDPIPSYQTKPTLTRHKMKWNEQWAKKEEERKKKEECNSISPKAANICPGFMTKY